MKITAIFQDWFKPTLTTQPTNNPVSAANVISSVTGKKGLSLTPMDGARAGHQLHRCIEATQRFVKPSAVSMNQHPHSLGSQNKSITEDITEISKKVSQLDVKKMVRAQHSLRDMLDISRTVLRLSYAVKNRDTHSSPAAYDAITPPSTMMADGLAEIALSLVDDILKQTEILFKQDKTLLDNNQKELLGRSVLESLKEDQELSKKLFDAGALPAEIHSKAEALQLLETSIRDLHGYIKSIIDNTNPGSFSSLIEESKSLRESMSENPSLLRIELADVMQKTAQELEEHYLQMLELEARLWRFMDQPRQTSTREDDLFSWLYYLLSTAQDPAFMRLAEDTRAESLERISLPEYHFDLDQ